MPSDKDIIRFESEIESAREWVRSLTDKQFAALDVSLQLKNVEANLELAQDRVKELKKQIKGLSAAPEVPQKWKNWICPRLMNELNYRFLGRRDVQEKVYGLPKGYLTDRDW